MNNLRVVPDNSGEQGSGETARDPRDVYLDAAREAILEFGWRRTTLTEVARRAGVSRMTIYRAWADMSTLVGDLMTREWGGVVEAVLAQDDAETDAVVRISGQMVRAAQVLRDNDLFVRIIELEPDLVLPYLFSRRGRSQQFIIDRITEAVAEAQTTGAARAGNPSTIARALVLAAHGFTLSAHTMVDEQTSEADLDTELTLLLERSLRP